MTTSTEPSVGGQGEVAVRGTPTAEASPVGGAGRNVAGAVSASGLGIGDPAPLGLAGFGITTLLLSVINAGWLPAYDTIGVLAMAIAFGGGAQLLAGMWAFRRGNTFAATAFTSYGAFWFSFFLLVQYFLAPIKAAGGVSAENNFLGLYLLAWGIFTAYMFFASLGSARAVSVVFILLAATFFLLSAGKYAVSETITHIGGYVGLATAAAAIYASFADVLNANLKRVILPTGEVHRA
ncbi:MAG: acetate uptake transporter [Candidatus Dormibacteria bacterium]